MKTINLRRSDKSVADIIAASFPEFRGRTVEATIAPTVTFHGTIYDAGNRRTYKWMRLADHKILPVPQEPYASVSRGHHTPFEIPIGIVVVVLVNSSLVPDYIEIISPAENITPLLPAPVDLTAHERTVLAAVAGFKSSSSEHKDLRFHEARRSRGISRQDYDDAKASLVSRKLLNKAGAITVEGRNAIGNERL